MTKNDIYTALCHSEQNMSLPYSYTASIWGDEQLRLMQARADEYLAVPTPALPYHLFCQYKLSGNRETYQKPYYDRRGRLLVFALLTWHSKGDSKYLTALEDIIWEICSEAFWCLPAHFLAADSSDLCFDEYSTQLDLFACETAFALAEALALCGDYLAPIVVNMADEQLYRRVFTPFAAGDRLYRFETMRNNWASVCGGAIGGAAIYRVKDAKLLATILHKADSCMQVYLSSFGDDGVCVEGVDYWSYGFGFYVAYAELLYRRTGGAIDLLCSAKAEAIARSFSAFYLGGKATVSFSDGSEHSGYRMGLLAYLARRYDGLCVPPRECAAPLLSDSCYRFCLGLRDLIWVDDAPARALATSGSTYFADAKWYIKRCGTLSLAAKGGNNGESHNHNDCGSFIIAKQGVQLICDLGAGLYDAAYFGDARYQIFVNRSSSHSVAMIDGAEQAPGEQYASTDDAADDNSFTTELHRCYTQATMHSYRRTFTASDNEIAMQDSFSFTVPCAVTEVFVSQAPIALTPFGARFEREGSCMEMRWQGGAARTDATEYINHHGDTVIAYRLLITYAPDNILQFNAVFK